MKYQKNYNEKEGATEIINTENNSVVARVYPTGEVEWLCVSAKVKIDEELKQLVDTIVIAYTATYLHEVVLDGEEIVLCTCTSPEKAEKAIQLLTGTFTDNPEELIIRKSELPLNVLEINGQLYRL